MPSLKHSRLLGTLFLTVVTPIPTFTIEILLPYTIQQREGCPNIYMHRCNAKQCNKEIIFIPADGK